MVHVFENIEKNVLVFFENCSCILNLVFSMFSRKKKKRSQTLFSLFSLFFRTKNSFKKHETNKPKLSILNGPSTIAEFIEWMECK